MITTLSRRFRTHSTQVSVAVLLTVLSGCAVAPKPITMAERTAQILSDKDAMFAGQDAISAPITLEDAIARALKYNLDNRLKLMEEALATRQLDMANFNLLPKLTASAGYSSRDNEAGSSSMDLLTGNRLPTSSTSQDKNHTATDLTLSWNVLDFGVSYFQAKQQANQGLILQERRRKVVQTMTQQVRQAYWQAVGAQLLEDKINSVMGGAELALTDSRTVEKERLRSPLESLNYQRQMLDILRQLESIRDELTQAKPRLASLMNLPPNADYRVIIPTQLEIPTVTAELSRMEELALQNRPELMEASYNERISVDETHKAIARLFPGIEFSAGTSHDTNSFLVNNQWSTTGVRIGWNLMNLLNISNTKGLANAQLEVSKNQRLALNMAVLTQVHVAYRDYLSHKHQYERNADMSSVDQRILTHTQNAANSSSDSQLQEIRASASALMSELRQYQSYGALQSAYGQILATLGVDLLPKELPSHDLAVLAQAVKKAEQTADSNFGTTTTTLVIVPADSPTPQVKKVVK